MGKQTRSIYPDRTHAQKKDTARKEKKRKEKKSRRAFRTVVVLIKDFDKTGVFECFPYVCPEPVLVKR